MRTRRTRSNAETNGHFFPLFSHVFTRHPVAFPSGAALGGGDPPYVPAETSDPKPCHRHRFLACFHRLLFHSLSDFPFGPYQVWPFAQVLAESALILLSAKVKTVSTRGKVKNAFNTEALYCVCWCRFPSLAVCKHFDFKSQHRWLWWSIA